MSFFQTKYKKEKRWICSCKRINGAKDLICAYCRKPKEEGKEKGVPRYTVAKRTDYNGRWYQSALEAKYAEQLDWRMRGGEILEWKPQFKVEFKVNGVKICAHYIDFRVVTKDGTVQFHECKGVETETYRIKKRLLLALMPEIEPGAEYIVIK